MLTKIAQSLPQPVTTFLKKTPVDDLWQSYKRRNLQLVTVTFDTPVGQLELSVPKGHPFVQKAEKPGGHEPAFTKELMTIGDSQAVFYDVGARFGYHTVLCEKLDIPENHIHAFEVDPLAFSVLQENHGNGSFLINRAVGDGSSGTMALDEYAKSNQSPNIIKIDVEGAGVMFFAVPLIFSRQPIRGCTLKFTHTYTVLTAI